MHNMDQLCRYCTIRMDLRPQLKHKLGPGDFTRQLPDPRAIEVNRPYLPARAPVASPLLSHARAATRQASLSPTRKDVPTC
jgi:hypothetical protein